MVLSNEDATLVRSGDEVTVMRIIAEDESVNIDELEAFPESS